MPHYLEMVVGSPWALAVVFAVAGLDAILPFMPSESTVVAVAVVAAGTGRPHLAALIGAAAAGAYAGDRLSYVIGRRSTRALAARLGRNRRSRAVHEWVHRLLHSRGGLIIVFARYVPGARSTTAFAAGLVRYPLARFRWYTAAGVLLWATQGALIGYLGGRLFADRPALGLAAAWTGAAVVTGCAIALQRLIESIRAAKTRKAAAERTAVMVVVGADGGSVARAGMGGTAATAGVGAADGAGEGDTECGTVASAGPDERPKDGLPAR